MVGDKLLHVGGSREPLLKGRLSTVDLLVCYFRSVVSDIENIIYFYKTSYLSEEVNRTELSLSISVPWWKCLAAQNTPAYHTMA